MNLLIKNEAKIKKLSSYVKESQFQEKVQKSRKLIRDIILTYGIDNLAISFNGGKDCTVLLDLIIKELKTLNLPEAVKALHIKEKNSFEEVNNFVETTCQRLGMHLYEFEGDMKPMVQKFLNTCPQIVAIFLGNRRTDPYSANLSSVDATDGDWPRFKRVHPLLDWNYHEIWYYILVNNIEYCELYNKGYTSLGGKNNSIPNPTLQMKDGKYNHACELLDETKERASRLQ